MNRELRSCLWKDNSSRCKILHTQREWTIWYNFHFHFIQCSSYSVSTLYGMSKRNRCMSAKKRWKCQRKTSMRGKLGKFIFFISHARQTELQSIFFLRSKSHIFPSRLLPGNLVHTRKNYMLFNLTSSVPMLRRVRVYLLFSLELCWTCPKSMSTTAR